MATKAKRAATRKKPLTLRTLKSRAEALPDEAQRKKTLEALNYIELLANTTNTDIRNWDLSTIFCKPNQDEFYSDKAILNQKFFEYRENAPKVEKPLNKVLDEASQKVLDECQKAFIQTTKAQLKNSIDAYHRSIRDYEATIYTWVRDAYRMGLALSGEVPKLSEEVAKVIEENYWDLTKFENNILYFATKNDTIIVWKDNLGEEQQTNLGKFCAKVDVQTMNISVEKFQRNKTANGFIHPHVGRHGNLCWGNGGATARKYQVSGELANLMRLLASLLNFYNDQGPYVRMEYYKTKKRTRKPKQETTPVAS